MCKYKTCPKLGLLCLLNWYRKWHMWWMWKTAASSYLLSSPTLSCLKVQRILYVGIWRKGLSEWKVSFHFSCIVRWHALACNVLSCNLCSSLLPVDTEWSRGHANPQIKIITFYQVPCHYVSWKEFWKVCDSCLRVTFSRILTAQRRITYLWCSGHIAWNG